MTEERINSLEKTIQAHEAEIAALKAVLVAAKLLAAPPAVMTYEEAMAEARAGNGRPLVEFFKRTRPWERVNKGGRHAKHDSTGH